MAASHKPPKIDTVQAFTDHGLIELKSWLEPWFSSGATGLSSGGGAQGPQGPVGPTGPAGPPGQISLYVYTQGTAAATWTVAHNLGHFPAVTVVDTGNNTILPDCHFIDQNNLTLTFGSATSGKAYCL